MLFGKRKRKSFDFSLVHTDIHSHLIPGIDDGSQDMDTSLQLINGLIELGYRKLVTTPHIMKDMYPNTREIIVQKFQLLNTEVRKQHPGIELHASAEYFLDDHFTEILEKKESLLTIGGNKVLVEFSFANPSLSLKEDLFDMQMQGYTPVLAHPERYMYLEKNKDFCDELKGMGCFFQLNILSLNNYYGKNVHDFAHYLIKRNYYELLGTDLHHSRHLEALHDPSLISPLNKLLDSGRIINPEL
jgi:tyrosine-protein phosphatase YwqE